MGAAPKKRAASAKKTTSKRTSAAKKKATKKVVKKTASKKVKVKPKDTFNKKKTEGRNPSHPELPKFPRSVTLRNRLALILLSPYRFPMHMDTTAINTARIAGLAFVFMGAMLASYNAFDLAQGLNGGSTSIAQVVGYSQTAQVGGSSDTATTDTGTSSDSSTTPPATTTASSTDEIATTTPAEYVKPELGVDKDTYTIGDTVTVSVRGSASTAPRIYAVSGRTGDEYDLGPTTETEAMVWQLSWPTKDMQTGSYIIYGSIPTSNNTERTNWEIVKLAQTESAAVSGETTTSPEEQMDAMAKESNFFADKMVLIASSVGVVILGLLLIILGLYFHRKEQMIPGKKSTAAAAQPEPQQTTA